MRALGAIFFLLGTMLFLTLFYGSASIVTLFGIFAYAMVGGAFVVLAESLARGEKWAITPSVILASLVCLFLVLALILLLSILAEVGGIEILIPISGVAILLVVAGRLICDLTQSHVVPPHLKSNERPGFAWFLDPTAASDADPHSGPPQEG
jgi:hypothetical protein